MVITTISRYQGIGNVNITQYKPVVNTGKPSTPNRNHRVLARFSKIYPIGTVAYKKTVKYLSPTDNNKGFHLPSTLKKMRSLVQVRHL